VWRPGPGQVADGSEEEAKRKIEFEEEKKQAQDDGSESPSWFNAFSTWSDQGEESKKEYEERARERAEQEYEEESKRRIKRWQKVLGMPAGDSKEGRNSVTSSDTGDSQQEELAAAAAAELLDKEAQEEEALYRQMQAIISPNPWAETFQGRKEGKGKS